VDCQLPVASLYRFSMRTLKTLNGGPRPTMVALAGRRQDEAAGVAHP
jgi:hypothetical protein